MFTTEWILLFMYTLLTKVQNQVQWGHILVLLLNLCTGQLSSFFQQISSAFIFGGCAFSDDSQMAVWR